MVWSHGCGEEDLETPDFPLTPAIKTAFPPQGPTQCVAGNHFWCPSWTSSQRLVMEIALLRTPGVSKKCVVPKCTWHFSSTTQLLSELATCALERRGARGAPKVLSLEFANTSGDDGSHSWMFYRRIKVEPACFFPSLAMWGTGLRF